jgi:hypothetical protein
MYLYFKNYVESIFIYLVIFLKKKIIIMSSIYLFDIFLSSKLIKIHHIWLVRDEV